MKSYSETHVFTTRARAMLERAAACVAAVPDDEWDVVRWGEIRCHELARAVGRVLDMRHVDGVYGAVHHTWLVVPSEGAILDVYAVGQLPQVRLIDVVCVGLPHRSAYSGRAPRTDIRHHVVDELVAFMRAALQAEKETR